METTKAEKCAYPIRSCITTSGKYCNTQCEAMEKMPDIDCSSTHAECNGRTH